MKEGDGSILRRMAMAVAATAAIASPSLAAQDPTVDGGSVVSVAIVDSNVRRLDFDDPNVRIVDMTPKAPDGTSFMKYKVTDFHSHGDIVASSFVREYRKLDATSPIVIYVVDPFVRKDGNVSANFSMRILGDALPRMKAAGVRIAITAFGIQDPAAGQRIADAFARNGMALFAAVPNDQNDRGIYPAATPGVVSVASERKGSAFEHDRAMSKWVTFSISGSHGSAHNTSDADGTSFSVAHAGAYGAYLMKQRPDTPITAIADRISSYGRRMPGMVGGRERATFRIGGSEMIRSVVADLSRTSPVARSDQADPELTMLTLATRSSNGR